MKMKLFILAAGMVAAVLVGCGDDSPAGGSSAGGSSAGGSSAGGQNTGGTPAAGGAAEGGAASQGLCADTSAVGSCPTLTGCPNVDDTVADVLCGCSAAQEGEFCQVSYDGGTSGCGFGANCTAGEWIEEVVQ